MTGFSVSGHADYAEYGSDIACASVSSAVMLTVNTITDVFAIKANAEVSENEISLELEEDSGGGDRLILGLFTHLSLLKEEFPTALNVTVSSEAEK